MTLFCKTFRKVSFNQVVGLQHLRVFIRARNDTMTLFLRKNHIHQHSDTLQQKTTQAEVKCIDKWCKATYYNNTIGDQFICLYDIGGKGIGYM